MVRGALIRANDKSDGPDRISQLSYGVEIMEEHNPERFSAHERVKPTVDKIDGRYYVNSTISWLIIKVRKHYGHKASHERVLISVGY